MYKSRAHSMHRLSALYPRSNGRRKQAAHGHQQRSDPRQLTAGLKSGCLHRKGVVTTKT